MSSRGRASGQGGGIDRATRRRVLAAAAALVLPVSRPAAAVGPTIRFGFRPVEPMVFTAAGGAITGLEYEIVATAFGAIGVAVKPYVGSNARLAEAIANGVIDGMAPATELGPRYVLSDAYLVYENVALTRAADGLRLETLADLGRHRVMGFQRAREVLGPAYAAAVAAAPTYREEAAQKRQVLSLIHGRVDVVVGEKRILRHFLREAARSGVAVPDMVEHPLFGPRPARAAFRDPVRAEQFNRGLHQIAGSGRLDGILARYADTI